MAKAALGLRWGKVGGGGYRRPQKWWWCLCQGEGPSKVRNERELEVLEWGFMLHYEEGYGKKESPGVWGVGSLGISSKAVESG